VLPPPLDPPPLQGGCQQQPLSVPTHKTKAEIDKNFFFITILTLLKIVLIWLSFGLVANKPVSITLVNLNIFIRRSHWFGGRRPAEPALSFENLAITTA
jgi:hypothetical protein